MKAYEALAEAFAAEETRALFGLMGDGNMYWMAAMATQPGVRVVHARHESAAVAMADGYARVTGTVGVCSVTCGPGLTQIGTSLTASVRHRTPLVAFAGDTPSAANFHLQEFDQRPFVESTGAGFIGVRSVDQMLDAVQRAFYAAAHERRPIVLSVPFDMQERDYPWEVHYQPSAKLQARPSVVAPDAAAISEVADLMARSRRPVILAGRGAIAAGAGGELRQLAERTGALLATSLRAKGWFDGHPRNAGVAGAFSRDRARELLTQADCVVGFGARMGYFTTEGGYLFPDAELVCIDTEPEGFRDGQRSADIAVRADARLAAAALLEALAGRGATIEGYPTEDIPAPDADALTTDGLASDGALDPDAVMATINNAVPAEWLTIVGAGHFWNFAVDGLSGRPPEGYLFTYDFGVIGQGLPTAMGAAVAGVRAPVALIEGDGSLLMNVQELETLVRHDIPLLVLCMNDGAYGAEVHKMRSKGVSAEEAIFGRADLAAVAKAFGARGRTATDLAGLRGAVEEFAAHPAPTVVDIRVSPEVISRQYRRLYFGAS